MATTDKDLAFIEINHIFNAIENEEKSNSWKLDELRKVLTRMQNDMYSEGVRRGFKEAQKVMDEHKDSVLTKICSPRP